MKKLKMNRKQRDVFFDDLVDIRRERGMPRSTAVSQVKRLYPELIK